MVSIPTLEMNPKTLGIGYSYLSIFAGVVCCILASASYSGYGVTIGQPGSTNKELNWVGISLIASGYGGRLTIPREIGKALPDSKAIANVGEILAGGTANDDRQ